MGPPTREEHEALKRLIADGRVATVRAIGSMIGRGVSATFPALAGLAALAVQRRSFYRPFEADEIEAPAPALAGRIVVTSVGMSSGEGMGLITAVKTASVGRPSKIIGDVEKFIEAGTTHFDLWFMYPRYENLVKEMKLFAKEVIPSFL